MDIDALLRRIEQRAQELDKSLRSVSLAATGSPDTIRNWKRSQKDGKNASMRHANLQAVANALEVDLHWLMTGEEAILGLEMPGLSEESFEYEAKTAQSDAVRHLYADSALRAEVVRRMAVSMPSLGLTEGDLVICDLGRDPHLGDTVLVHVQDGRANGSTYIRRWFSPWLLALDPELDSDPLRDDETGVTVRYPVIGCIRGA